jgi:hypothetical protein
VVHQGHSRTVPRWCRLRLPTPRGCCQCLCEGIRRHHPVTVPHHLIMCCAQRFTVGHQCKQPAATCCLLLPGVCGPFCYCWRDHCRLPCAHLACNREEWWGGCGGVELVRGVVAMWSSQARGLCAKPVAAQVDQNWPSIGAASHVVIRGHSLM